MALFFSISIVFEDTFFKPNCIKIGQLCRFYPSENCLFLYNRPSVLKYFENDYFGIYRRLQFRYYDLFTFVYLNQGAINTGLIWLYDYKFEQLNAIQVNMRVG